MRRPHNRAITNETKHPHIVEVAIAGNELGVQLTRRIVEFHRLQHIEPRLGRRTYVKRGLYYFRWCFAEFSIACAFIEQFGGEYFKHGI